MKNLYFESVTTLKFDAPVVDHHFLLRYLPTSYSGQRIVSATLVLTPGVAYTLSCDGFGNLNETGCIKFPHWEFIYAVSGLAVICEAERQQERLHPLYKYPTPLTQTNEAMRAFVKSLHSEGGVLHCALGKGVCQDFAHLYIALARLAGIRGTPTGFLLARDRATHGWRSTPTECGWGSTPRATG